MKGRGEVSLRSLFSTRGRWKKNNPTKKQIVIIPLLIPKGNQIELKNSNKDYIHLPYK